MSEAEQAGNLARMILAEFLSADPRVLRAWDRVSKSTRDETIETAIEHASHALDRAVDRRLRSRLAGDEADDG